MKKHAICVRFRISDLGASELKSLKLKEKVKHTVKGFSWLCHPVHLHEPFYSV